MNHEQIKSLSGPEMDKEVALAQGWVNMHGLWYKNSEHLGLYTPTADTVEGKAQCFDLMVTFNISPLTDENTVSYNYITSMANIDNGFVNYQEGGLQRAICEAFLMSKQDDQ